MTPEQRNNIAILQARITGLRRRLASELLIHPVDARRIAKLGKRIQRAKQKLAELRKHSMAIGT